MIIKWPGMIYLTLSCQIQQEIIIISSITVITINITGTRIVTLTSTADSDSIVHEKYLG